MISSLTRTRQLCILISWTWPAQVITIQNCLVRAKWLDLNVKFFKITFHSNPIIWSPLWPAPDTSVIQHWRNLRKRVWIYSFMSIHLFWALECFPAVNNNLLPRYHLNGLTCKVHVHYKQPVIRSLVTLKLSYLYELLLRHQGYQVCFWSIYSTFLLYWRLLHNIPQIMNLLCYYVFNLSHFCWGNERLMFRPYRAKTCLLSH